MRIQGQLDGDILVNLLQYLNLNNASGVLRLQTGLGSEGAVYTSGGQVVHAVTGQLTGVKALITLLRWQQGRFSFQTGESAPAVTIDKPLEALLLEVAYESDVEDTAVEELHGSTVLMPARRHATPHQGVTLPMLAIRVLPLLDSNISLQAVAARLRTPLPEVLDAARAIIAAGLAHPHRSANLSQEFIHSLTTLVRDIMGPLADIVMDEALYDLNLSDGQVPEDQLPDLLRLLGLTIGQERSDWRDAFDRQVDELLRRHGLARGGR